MIREITDIINYNPQNEYSFFIQQYFSPILEDGIQKYIKNLNVEVKILEVNNTLIPITFGNSQKGCFSSSLLGMFEYLQDESDKAVKNSLLKGSIKLFSKLMNSFIIKRFKLYKIIFVNNICLSTCLYPELKDKDFFEIKNFLSSQYPDYAIIFRSINNTEKKYLQCLSKLGFRKVIFRQVFLSYGSKFDSYKKIKEYKGDKKVFIKNNYIKSHKKNYSQKELKEIKECYDSLYLNKYSYLNPQITLEFLKEIQNNNFFSLNTLMDEKGKIDAIFGYYEVNGSVTAPLFGYKNIRLYRDITYCYITEVLENKQMLNWSSGVGKFKMLRGAEKSTEYFMIYYKHLGFGKRLFWNIVYLASKHIGEPYFKKHVL